MQIPVQSWMSAAASCQVMAALAQGGEARFVGGCVRDALLERPVKDIDIACTHPPESAMALLKAAGLKVIPTGLAHGTITVVAESKEAFEVTTLREDVACDGRHAEVAFTDNWQADAARRDFTMNALYLDGEGNLTDFFGGVEDAKIGRIRFIGDAKQRIAEDALRILRYFRFYAHYGKAPFDAGAITACADGLGQLAALSGERICQEMFKLLVVENPERVLLQMQEIGVLETIALVADLSHFSTLLEIEPEPDAVRRLACMLQGQDVTKLANRWKLSNVDKARLKDLTSADLSEASSWNVAAQKQNIRKKGATRFADYVLLAWAVEPEQAEKFKAMLQLAKNWTPPEFPLTGAAVMALGVPHGPDIGKLLTELEDWW